MLSTTVYYVYIEDGYMAPYEANKYGIAPDVGDIRTWVWVCYAHISTEREKAEYIALTPTCQSILGIRLLLLEIPYRV